MWFLLCLIPLLIFFPGINDFFFLPGNSYSDITITHFPNYYYLQQSLRSGAGIPLWSPNILSGYPFIANPLSGLHYPPGWLTILFPLPMGINLVAALHLVLGSYGMYRWVKAEGVQPFVAGLSALTFGLLPKLIGHYSAGHLMLTFAICWTPWLLLAEKRTADSLGKRDELWRSPGVILGLITLADIRWSFYGGLIWLIYTGIQRLPGVRSIKRFTHLGLYVLKQFAITAAVSAVLLLPFMQYLSLSTRTTMTTREVLEHSLPFSGILNLIFPTTGGDLEWIAYPGAVSLALVVIGVSNRQFRKRALPWMILALASFLLSFGSNIPGMESLAGIPGFSLIRVPARFLFLTCICLVISAAFILDGLLSMDPNKQHIHIMPLIAFGVAVLIFSVGACFLTGQIPVEAVVGGGGLFLAMILIVIYVAGRLPARAFCWTLLAVLVINLAGIALYFMQHKSTREVLAQGAGPAQVLSEQPGLFRVYSPSYDLPQQTAAFYHLQLAEGVDPMQLQNYKQYMIEATGIPSTGYSVALPQFIPADTGLDAGTYLPDAEVLGLLNIRYVVADFDMIVDGLTQITVINKYHIYENQYSQPRAWLQSADGTETEVQILEFLPNRITLQAEGPGRLFLAEIAYPGWQVQVDQEAPSAVGMHDLIRSVELSEGSHEIRFVFRPLTAYIGAGISLFTMLILIGLGILHKNKNK